MPYPNEHAARITDPGQYDSFRRQNDRFGSGIHAIFGVKNGPPRTSELQSIRFDKAKFSVEEAKKWLKNHKYTPIAFEPASGGEKSADGWYGEGPRERLFYRAVTIRAADVDEDARTLTLTFSSEARVNRWWLGTEILAHGKGNVDLSQLTTTGGVLFNHSPFHIVGSIQRAWIGQDRRGHAVMRFDEDEESEIAMRKVQSGSLRGVSVGYLIQKVRKVREDEECDFNGETIKGPAMIAVRWKPIEFSLTPIPADADVGVGRDLTRSLDGIEIEQPEESEAREPEMDKRTRQYLESRGLDPEATEEQAWAHLEAVREEDAERAKREAEANKPEPEPEPASPAAQSDPAAERKAVAERLSRVVERAGALGQTDLALKLAREGKDDLAICEAVMEAAAKQRTAPVGPGAAGSPESLDQITDDELARAINQPHMNL